MERVFWFNETMVGFMDFDTAGKYHLGTTGIGQLSPPSVYAFSGEPLAYASGSSGPYSKLEMSASLEFFGDFECKEPL